MAPKRAKQPAAGKKAAADKPPAGGGGGSGGGALNGDNGAAPAHAAGSKRGRKELEDAEEYEATVPGRGSAAEEKGTGGAKRAAPDSASWAMLATHLPGRSGRECKDRWARYVEPDLHAMAVPLREKRGSGR